MLLPILALVAAQSAGGGPRVQRDPVPAVRREPSPHAEPRGPDAELEAARALGRLAVGEPAIEDVQAAAARRAGFDSGRAESWRSRARSAAWLPRLTAEYRHDERNYRVIGLTGSGEVDYLRANPGDVYGIRATWALDALIFNPSEVRAAATAAHLLRRRDEMVERATRLFFRRQRLRLALLVGGPASPQARAEAELEIAEVTSELDALTDGLFSGRSP
jgi:hypothetical protein